MLQKNALRMLQRMRCEMLLRRQYDKKKAPDSIEKASLLAAFLLSRMPNRRGGVDKSEISAIKRHSWPRKAFRFVWRKMATAPS